MTHQDENFTAANNKFYQQAKEFITLIRSDTAFIHLIEEHIFKWIIKVQNKNRKDKRRFALLSLGIAVLSALLAANSVMTQLKISDAESKIQQYTVWLRDINNAMMDLRKTNAIIQTRRIQGTVAQVMRFNSIAKVANAYTGAEGIVGNLVSKNASLFNQFDENVRNLLSKTTPSDSAWRYYMVRNSVIISLKIRNQLNIINEAQKSPPSRIISNFENMLTVLKARYFL